MVVVGSVDADGRVWASPLVGEPGFVRMLALPLISLPPTFPFCVFTEVESDGSVDDQRRTVLPRSYILPPSTREKPDESSMERRPWAERRKGFFGRLLGDEE